MADADSLPDGWSARWSDKRHRYYYVNGVTKASQWEVPTHPVTQNVDAHTSAVSTLPAGWDKRYSRTHGRSYYVFVSTGYTQWKRPAGHVTPNAGPTSAIQKPQRRVHRDTSSSFSSSSSGCRPSAPAYSPTAPGYYQ